MQGRDRGRGWRWGTAFETRNLRGDRRGNQASAARTRGRGGSGIRKKLLHLGKSKLCEQMGQVVQVAREDGNSPGKERR